MQLESKSHRSCPQGAPMGLGELRESAITAEIASCTGAPTHRGRML